VDAQESLLTSVFPTEQDTDGLELTLFHIVTKWNCHSSLIRLIIKRFTMLTKVAESTGIMSPFRED